MPTCRERTIRFPTITKDLAIKDFIKDIPETGLLHEIQDWKIDDFKHQENIDSLPLSAVLTKEQMESNTLLKHLASSTIGSLSADVEALTINQILEDQIYATDEATGEKTLKGTWKYLLKKEDGTVGEYSIKEMDAMVSNMTRNIQGATIDELVQDKIVQADEEFLNTDIIYELKYKKLVIAEFEKIYANPPQNTVLKGKLRELTINELMRYVSNVVSKLNELE